MYCLEVIKDMNARAARAKRAEDPFSRECSFVCSRDGVVIHSALRRSTAFIADPKDVAQFLRRVARCRSSSARNKVIESYF